MGIMPDPHAKHTYEENNPFEKIGMDTSEAVQAETAITVDQLADVVAKLQQAGFGSDTVVPYLVDPAGHPLDLPMTIVGVGREAEEREAILLIFPGTTAEWQSGGK